MSSPPSNLLSLSLRSLPHTHADSEQDLTYYACSWMIVACIFALALQDICYLDWLLGNGSDGETWQMNSDYSSWILIANNLLIVVQIGGSSEFKRIRDAADKLRRIFDAMTAAEAADLIKLEGAWQSYVDDADPGADEILYTKMSQLAALPSQ